MSSLLAIALINFRVCLLVASEGSVKSAGSRKVDSKCPNAGNPFHECGEHCAAKMQQVEQHKGTKMQSPRKNGRALHTDGHRHTPCLWCYGTHALISSLHCNGVVELLYWSSCQLFANYVGCHPINSSTILSFIKL